jgi:UPF0755 protein
VRGFSLYFGMFRKSLPVLAVTLILGGILYFLVGSGTGFEGSNGKDIYIPTKVRSRAEVLDSVRNQIQLKHEWLLNGLMQLSGYEKRIKPGRYRISKGMSLFSIFRKLYTGRTDALDLVLNKFRTKEQLAGYLGRKLEPDSTAFMQYLSSIDSVQPLGLDTHSILTIVIPDTYSVDWNISVSRFMRRMVMEKDRFWTAERKGKADQLKLTPEQVYVLASIVEEETNQQTEKPTISSVYLNRIRRGMPLGADPTVKFALRDFTIKRILFNHIRKSSASPYNTYANKGLPPGPICTPSRKTLEAVLNTPETSYLFFCARPDFSGYHAFSSSEKEHFRNARAFHNALDSLSIK